MFLMLKTSLAIQNNMAVQDLNYNKLKSVLKARGQILEWNSYKKSKLGISSSFNSVR